MIELNHVCDIVLHLPAANYAVGINFGGENEV